MIQGKKVFGFKGNSNKVTKFKYFDRKVTLELKQIK
jgi:hypothetical protein